MIEDRISHEGARRAALALHALGKVDRDWLLQRLGPEQRASMTALLNELRSLGIPPDGEIVRRVLDEQAVPVDKAQAPEDDALMCRALERETNAVRELMLSTLSAEAAAAVCQCWNVRDELQPQHRPGVIETPAVRDAVLEAWRNAARTGSAAS